jgi:hypothetical protein
MESEFRQWVYLLGHRGGYRSHNRIIAVFALGASWAIWVVHLVGTTHYNGRCLVLLLDDGTDSTPKVVVGAPDAIAPDTIPRAVILADTRRHLITISNEALCMLVVVETTGTRLASVTLLAVTAVILEPPLLVLGLEMRITLLLTTEELDPRCVRGVLTLVAVVVEVGGISIAVTAVDSRATVHKMHALANLGVVLLDVASDCTSEHCKGLLAPRNRALEGSSCTRRNGGSSRSIHNNSVGRHTTYKYPIYLKNFNFFESV